MSLYKRSELLENFKGDEDILSELISEFLLKSDQLIEQISIAIKNNDSKSLNLHAHTYKGVISNFYADEIKELAYKLEKMGEGTNLIDAEKYLIELISMVNDLKVELMQLQKEL